MKYLIGLILWGGTLSVSFSQQIQLRKSSPSKLSTSVASVTKPLLIIDGEIMPNLVKSKIDSSKMVDPLDEINSNDIEKVEILKGLQATTVYGEAARNGVVKITMKKITATR